MTTVANRETVNLLEFAGFDPGNRIDEEKGVIRGVKVLGRVSLNKYEYSDAALQQAAKLYEGVRVNLNHPSRDNLSAERPFEASIGWLRKGEVRADGVYADLHYLKLHPYSAALVEMAKRNPNRVGLSHNADGERRGSVVESIVRVRSVDIVQRPATVEGLFESDQFGQLLEGDGMQLMAGYSPPGATGLEVYRSDPASKFSNKGDSTMSDEESQAIKTVLRILRGPGDAESKVSAIGAALQDHFMNALDNTPSAQGAAKRPAGYEGELPESEYDRVTGRKTTSHYERAGGGRLTADSSPFARIFRRTGN